MRLTLLGSSVLATLVTLPGCSKSDQASATPADATEPAAATEGAASPDGDQGHQGHGDGHHMEHGQHAHHDFPPAVDAFHEVLQPLWHAEAGDARVADTCAATADLLDKADAIVFADAPEGTSDADAWKTNATALTSALQALDETCKDDPASFDASFKGVHDAFHELVALIGHGG